jgi:hypothetical protein
LEAFPDRLGRILKGSFSSGEALRIGWKVSSVAPFDPDYIHSGFGLQTLLGFHNGIARKFAISGRLGEIHGAARTHVAHSCEKKIRLFLEILLIKTWRRDLLGT